MVRPFLDTVLVLVPLALCGCVDPEHNKEHRNLTYEEYCKRFPRKYFDPKGAKSISYRSYTTRDSYDVWWKIEISRKDWLKIVKEIGLTAPRPFSPESKPNGELGVPATWPVPHQPAPDWWLPPRNFGSMIAISQTQKNGRATGWYWLYDADSSKAIGWHWNHQHWRFSRSNSHPDLRRRSRPDKPAVETQMRK